MWASTRKRALVHFLSIFFLAVFTISLRNVPVCQRAGSYPLLFLRYGMEKLLVIISDLICIIRDVIKMAAEGYFRAV